MDTLSMAILAGAAYIGYINCIVNKLNISIFLAPTMLITSACALMYFAGLLNIMPICAYGVLAAGWILLVRYRRSFSVSRLQKRWFALALCCGIGLYLIYYVWGGVLKDGDTMTHWGIMVKSMCKNDGLPNFGNPEIKFQSYPPGTACWLWLVAKLVGYSDGNVMFAQGFWMYSCIISLFALNKSGRKAGDLLIAFAAFYFLKGLDELRVDILLALLTVSAMVTVAEEQSDALRLSVLLLPFMIVLPLVKSSGLLFAFFVFGAAWLAVSKNQKQSGKWLGISGLGTVVSVWLWQAHIDMVYAHANSNRHSLSLGYMRSVFGEKTPEDIRTIFDAFVSEWFSGNLSFEWIILAAFLLTGLAALLISERKTEVKWLTALGLGCYLLYKAGLLGMYLFNMPGEDALKVASYYRYQETFSMLMAAMALYLYFAYVDVCPKTKAGSIGNAAGILILLVMFGLPIHRRLDSILKRPDYRYGGVHRQITTMLQEYGELEKGDKVLVYHSYEFARYFARFAMENWECGSTGDCGVIREALDTNEKDYDWVILLEKDPQVELCLKESGLEPDAVLIPLAD